MKNRLGDQPLPITTTDICVQDEVIKDIIRRKQLGIERYGSELHPWNNRDAIRDLYEELMDAILYLKQHMIEVAQHI